MPNKRADVWAGVQAGRNGELSKDTGHVSESDGEGRQERQDLGLSGRVGVDFLQFADFGKEKFPCLCFTSS